MRSRHQLILNAKLAAQFEKSLGARETLRSKFEYEALPPFGPDHAPGTRRRFDDLRVNAGLAQSIGADQPGYAGANNKDWKTRGHGTSSNPIISNPHGLRQDEAAVRNPKML